MSERFNFTNAYKKIEEINEWFQEENIDLDEAIKKYKEGMELIEKCKKRLKETENKFEDIKNKYSVEDDTKEDNVEENENKKEKDGNEEGSSIKDIPF